MDAPAFAPGFRLSKLDIAVLITGAVLAVAASTVDPWLGGVVGFVVGHFFLFCNVFRMSRPFELIWAACFMALAVGTLLALWPGWIVTFSVCILATAILVGMEMKRPSYHGVAWERINPGLRQWWQAQHGEHP